ncbi:MAG: hypothetical protein MUE40_18015 [Anaerolineae bacterium]|jgi:hypothetical protein|nr:hypothetical protein [Anaerolineae bacterium]
MSSSVHNVFAILKPDMMNCMVAEYHWGRATMTVKLNRENSPEVHYIRFGGVEYFAGPMHWRGASFAQRPASDCLELLRRAGRVNEFVEEETLKERNIRLFVVQLEQSEVQIVCHLANKYSG